MCRGGPIGNCSDCGAVISCRDYVNAGYCPACELWSWDGDDDPVVAQIEPLTDLIEQIFLERAATKIVAFPKEHARVFARRLLNNGYEKVSNES